MTAGWHHCERRETSPVQRGFPTASAMNARGMDNRMSTCRTRMNPSVACAARASARSFTRVHTNVAAHPRVINQPLQTMAPSTAFRAWLWRSDMAQQNQNPNQKQQGQQNQQDQQQGRGRDQQQQQQQEQQQRNQRNQQQGGQDEEE
ncbi:hypothetical protein JY458_15545 [Stenotrophomonas maltophilia]|nr:hypothetical protein [Stenotrophomonas maltophilia]